MIAWTVRKCQNISRENGAADLESELVSVHAFQNLRGQRSYLDTRYTQQRLKSIILHSTKADFPFHGVSLCVSTYLYLYVDQGWIR